ncbi:MAG: tyrosine-type recombinase/integrase [Steroidobacteraceae bacterium]
MATVRKHHNNWVAEYRDPRTRKLKRERPKGAFPNKALEKRAAEELLARRRAEISTGSFDPDSATRTFDVLCTEYFKQKVWPRATSEKNMRGPVDCYLRPYFGWMPLQSIKRDKIDAFRKEMTLDPLPPAVLDALRQRRSDQPVPRMSRARRLTLKPGPHTINRSLRILRVLLEYAHAREWVLANAARRIEMLPAASRKVVLSDEELRRVLASTEGPPRDASGVLTAPSPNWALIIKVAALTGMRQGEILGLQWHDLHASADALYVERTWKDGQYNPPKTDNSKRWVEVPPSLMVELRTWQTELRNIGASVEGHDPVFPTRSGAPHTPANLMHRGWYPTLKRAGVYDAATKTGKHVRFHDLRRTIVTNLHAVGESEAHIAQQMGHDLPTMRAVYVQPIARERRGGVDRFASRIGETETTPRSSKQLKIVS